VSDRRGPGLNETFYFLLSYGDAKAPASLRGLPLQPLEILHRVGIFKDIFDIRERPSLPIYLFHIELDTAVLAGIKVAIRVLHTSPFL
jgi:hypothetical protein